MADALALDRPPTEAARRAVLAGLERLLMTETNPLIRAWARREYLALTGAPS